MLLPVFILYSKSFSEFFSNLKNIHSFITVLIYTATALKKWVVFFFYSYYKYLLNKDF